MENTLKFIDIKMKRKNILPHKIKEIIKIIKLFIKKKYYFNYNNYYYY